MSIAITAESPNSPDAVSLIDELDAILTPLYAAKSRHGFSVRRLIDEGVAFFVVRCDAAPAGCGGIKLVGTEFGELKRMYVRPQFRGRGLGKALIDRLAAHAQSNGVTLLRLETGIHQLEAIRLYERYGFKRIPPFPPYREDPLSRCYELPIS